VLVPDVRVRRTATFPQAKSAAAAEMARGSFGEVAHVELMEQGVCNVVHGNTVNQRAAYVRRLAAVGLTLLAAAVVCAALVGGSTPGANQVSACARSGRAAAAARISVAFPLPVGSVGSVGPVGPVVPDALNTLPGGVGAERLWWRGATNTDC